MLQPVSMASNQELHWLRGLRWIDRADRAWLLVMPAALCAWVLALWPVMGWPAIVLPAGSHIILACCAVACAPRGRLHIYCGLVLLSQLHFLIFAAMGYVKLALLGQAYAVIALGAALGCLMLHLQYAARYRAALHGTRREDYRWLLTLAPLPWRMLFAHKLRRLAQ